MAADSGRAGILTAMLLGCGLVAVAISKLSYGVAAVGARRELNYGESFVYGRAPAVVSGLPLYHALDQAPFTIAAYTPLY
jgi:hypothetical protein